MSNLFDNFLNLNLFDLFFTIILFYNIDTDKLEVLK